MVQVAQVTSDSGARALAAVRVAASSLLGSAAGSDDSRDSSASLREFRKTADSHSRWHSRWSSLSRTSGKTKWRRWCKW
jgi:hypothetical protein